MRAVRLTGGSRAAVAVWSISGSPEAFADFERQSVRFRGPSTSSVDHVRLVSFGPPPGEEAVYVRRGEGRAEIHTHGGAAVAERVEAVLRSCDFASISAEPLTFADECEQTFARAITRRTAKSLATVCFGKLETSLRAIRAKDADTASVELKQLLVNSDLGLSLTTPRRVVLFGPPNAGKSSLMNALAGYERSIVAPEPGVTRDAVTVRTAFEGWPAELVDTAGLREAVSAVEREGVGRTRGLLQNADLRLLVIDSSEPCPEAAELMPLADLIVRHKCDRPDRSGVDWPAGTVSVSSTTGVGRDELIARLGTAIRPVEPPTGEMFFVTSRQIEAAERLQRTIAGGRDASAEWSELLLEDSVFAGQTRSL